MFQLAAKPDEVGAQCLACAQYRSGCFPRQPVLPYLQDSFKSQPEIHIHAGKGTQKGCGLITSFFVQQSHNSERLSISFLPPWHRERILSPQIRPCFKNFKFIPLSCINTAKVFTYLKQRHSVTNTHTSNFCPQKFTTQIRKDRPFLTDPDRAYRGFKRQRNAISVCPQSHFYWRDCMTLLSPGLTRTTLTAVHPYRHCDQATTSPKNTLPSCLPAQPELGMLYLELDCPQSGKRGKETNAVMTC